MEKRTIPRDRDRGAVAVIVSVLLGCGVVLPMTALVVDVGSIYVEREELQSGADAAAMAIAKDCLAGKCEASDIPNQIAIAKNHAGANAKDGHTAVSDVCGNWGSLPACPAPTKTNLSTCSGPVPSGNYVEIRVRTETDSGSNLLPPLLAKTFVGNESYDGTTVGGCARVVAEEVCVSATEATYKHTFNGPQGEATITANQPLCVGEVQPFTLVSYTAPASTFKTPQYLYDVETKTITSSTTSLSFKIDVPACYNQVDFVFGSQAVNPLLGIVYGDKKVGSSGPPGNRSVGPPAWYNGGTRSCDPQPSVTAKSLADKTLRLKLTSGSGANVDAVFTVKTSSGENTIHRVTKGTTKTVIIPEDEASNVQVQDNVPEGNDFDWATYKWKKP